MNTKAIEAVIFFIALALLVCSAWVKGSHHGAASVQAKWDAVKVSHQAVVVAKQADVISTNQAEDAKAEKVDTHVQEQTRILAASVARTAAERDGLREQLAAVRADTMSEATTRARLAAEAAAAADSLSECSSRYAALAGSHDELSIQVSGLLDLLPPP